MIDIHNHMLPAVDDGANSPEVSLAMLQEAVRQGVEHLVMTPHLYESDIIISTDDWTKRIAEGSRILDSLISEHKLPIKISIAAEVHFQDLLSVILEEMDVLIGGKYLLLEFSFVYVPDNIEKIIFELTSKGVLPLIAHPERIKPWQRDPQRLEELINLGCPLQVDIGSFLGTLGAAAEKLSHLLFERYAVHVVGSDSHNMGSRALYTKPGYDWITERYGDEQANLLLNINPARILAGENVVVYPVDLKPIHFSLKEKILNIIKI